MSIGARRNPLCITPASASALLGPLLPAATMVAPALIGVVTLLLTLLALPPLHALPPLPLSTESLRLALTLLLPRLLPARLALLLAALLAAPPLVVTAIASVAVTVTVTISAI